MRKTTTHGQKIDLVKSLLATVGRALLQNMGPVVKELTVSRLAGHDQTKTRPDIARSKKDDASLRLCVSVAFADCVITDKEAEMLARHFGITTDKLEAEIADTTVQDIDYKALPRIFVMKKDRVTLWKFLYAVALADSIFDDREQELLDSIAQAFGFTPEEVQSYGAEVMKSIASELPQSKALPDGKKKSLLNAAKKHGTGALRCVSEIASEAWAKTDKRIIVSTVIAALGQFTTKKPNVRSGGT